MTHPPAADTPRWTTRLWLGAVVLGLHLWLLVGEVPDGTPTASSRPAAPAMAQDSEQNTPGTQPQAASAVQPVTVSQVRWITPPPSPTRSPKAPQQASKKAVQPEPAPQPPTPPVSSEAVATAPPAPAPEPLRESATTAAPTAETAAQATGAPAPGNPATPTQALPPARVPGSAQLAYEVNGTIRGIGYSADGLLEWNLGNGLYEARMTVRLPLLGSRSQTSTGRVDGSGLLPERFADKSSRERAAHFDHEQQRIRFSNNAPEAVLQAGAQDRLSVFLQLAARLQAAPVQAGQLLEFQVAGAGGADLWRFRVGEEALLDLPAGEMRARRLVREARGPHDTQVELWLAPGLEHLPVRIRLEQSSGDQVDQQLSRLP